MAEEAENQVVNVTSAPPAETAAIEAPASEPVTVEPVALDPVVVAPEPVEAAPAEVLPEAVAAPAPRKRGRPPKMKAAALEAAPQPAPVAAKPAAPKAARKAAAAKPARKIAVKLAAKPAARTIKPAAPVKPKTVITRKPTIKNISAGKPTLSQSKETNMAKTTTIDFTAPIKTAIADLQGKAKTVYEKGTVAFGEANDFAKGNVEAIVESSKILASGLQELGATMVTDSRSAFETASAEVKGLAAVKTPAEFFQLQSTLARKNFDTMVAQASKSTEAMFKLANEVMSPLSTRVTLAVEKASKAA